MAADRYEFTPMTVADLPLIRRWLETPHVAEWWHDPAEQFELVSGDLGHPDMAQFIVSTDAHSTGALNYLPYGVSTARRGWLTREEVLNTLDTESFMKEVRP